MDEDTSQRVHDLLLQFDAELTERFGDRDVSDAEVRAFLTERLVAGGRSAREIEELLGPP